MEIDIRHVGSDVKAARVCSFCELMRESYPTYEILVHSARAVRDLKKMREHVVQVHGVSSLSLATTIRR